VIHREGGQRRLAFTVEVPLKTLIAIVFVLACCPVEAGVVHFASLTSRETQALDRNRTVLIISGTISRGARALSAQRRRRRVQPASRRRPRLGHRKTAGVAAALLPPIPLGSGLPTSSDGMDSSCDSGVCAIVAGGLANRKEESVRKSTTIAVDLAKNVFQRLDCRSPDTVAPPPPPQHVPN
jgi:hypothetical protein